jgi:hypothetical protein
MAEVRQPTKAVPMLNQRPDAAELRILKEQFLELVEREPDCELGTLFDEVTRQRMGAMIARLARRPV